MNKNENIKSINEMVESAQNALSQYLSLSQEQIDKIVKAISEKAFQNSEKLAKMAIDETKMGVLEDKITKNIFASKNIYEEIKNKKTVGIISKDKSKLITEIADPLGVIACVTPVTNPTSTTIFKSLICVKTRNPIIFAFHPKAQKCCVETAKMLYDEAVKFGAPKDCIQWVQCPSLKTTIELMNHKAVNVVLATGGADMVKSAYSTGKPALGVGPGNVPCYIEKTADIKRACEDIILSKTFDFGMICASEQSVIVDKEISKEFEETFKKLGCKFLNNNEIENLSDFIIDKNTGKLNSKIVGKSALEIANMVGIQASKDTKILVAKLYDVGKKVSLSAEKLSPILSYYVAEDKNHAFELCKKVLNFGGLGHTVSIHSKDENIIDEFGLEMKAGRIIVNSPSTHGAIGGIYNFNTPSLTLGCGSYGKNSTSSNISVDNLINIKKIFRRVDF